MGRVTEHREMYIQLFSSINYTQKIYVVDIFTIKYCPARVCITITVSPTHHLTNPVAHTEAETASRAAASCAVLQPYIYFLDNKKSS